ncbi:MAG TPA: DUF4105 domain-containing protein, partial [Elusimicrobiales bacterium]|nr:DUF4105 domain-containing protein [Elusimicrobiales bacterium]
AFTPFTDYMRVALRESKDTVLFYPYKADRDEVAMMFHNAIRLAEEKKSFYEKFGLLDNNCIINTLEIPNSLRPEDKQLRGCVPQITARQLQLQGVVGNPVKVSGQDLLSVNFDKLSAN